MRQGRAYRLSHWVRWVGEDKPQWYRLRGVCKSGAKEPVYEAEVEPQA